MLYKGLIFYIFRKHIIYITNKCLIFNRGVQYEYLRRTCNWIVSSFWGPQIRLSFSFTVKELFEALNVIFVCRLYSVSCQTNKTECLSNTLSYTGGKLQSVLSWPWSTHRAVSAVCGHQCVGVSRYNDVIEWDPLKNVKQIQLQRE